MEAGLVKSASHIDVFGSIVSRPGTCDKKDQRRRVILQRHRVDHLMSVPEKIRQLAFRKHIEPLLLEFYLLHCRQLGLGTLGSAYHSGDKPIGERIAVVFYSYRCTDEGSQQ